MSRFDDDLKKIGLIADQPQVQSILNLELRDPEVDLTALGRDLDGFSAADCAALIREAALVAMRESLEATSVTAKHVEAARQRVRPSLDPVQVARLEAYAQAH